MDRGGLASAGAQGGRRLSRTQFRIRTAARRDLDAYVDYLLAAAGAGSASRFTAAARSSFAALAESPHMGMAVESGNPRLAGLRKWRVKGFPKLLIFYQPAADSIRIVRVVHAAADWWALLDVN